MSFSTIKSADNLAERFRSYLRTTYQFRDPALREQFESKLNDDNIGVKGPYVTLARDFVQGKTLDTLVGPGKGHKNLAGFNWPFGGKELYAHQQTSLELGWKDRSFIITTGTGSGKTEAFLLPVIDGILKRKENGVKGVQAILLYPMNALANDQLERLRKLVKGTKQDLSFGLYTGNSDATAPQLKEPAAETERATRAQIRSNPPDILLTNYKQLEFLLVRKEDRSLFSSALKYLVLDEIHSYKGGLASEIACLIRRLKAHCRLPAASLICIGTSATIEGGEKGRKGLCRFVSDLFGEAVEEESIVPEHYREHPGPKAPYEPASRSLDKDWLMNLDLENPDSIRDLAVSLTGKPWASSGPLAFRIRTILEGNLVVRALIDIFVKPVSILESVDCLRKIITSRSDTSDEDIRNEIEAYLVLGSLYEESHEAELEGQPYLRPKLHIFFHGLYDVNLCTNPTCRHLVYEGGTHCPDCESVSFPAALCRTCGQDFVKVRLDPLAPEHPVGSADYRSDETTGFLTWKLHNPEEDEEEEDEEETEETAKKKKKKSAKDVELQVVSLCPECGRISEKGQACPEHGKGHEYQLYRWTNKKKEPKAGILHTCPTCKDNYKKADIISPLRTGTASTVSVIVTHQLELLKNNDHKLLLFADNRQDAAFQSGYTSDRHRTAAFRHILAKVIREAGSQGIAFDDIPAKIIDNYIERALLRRKLTPAENVKWKEVFTYQLAMEFSYYTRLRTSLENLGIAGVDYEFLDDLEKDPRFIGLATRFGLEPSVGRLLARAVLDEMRRNRAIQYNFFQEYIDINRLPYREWEGEPFGVRFPDFAKKPKGFALDRPDHVKKATQSVLGYFSDGEKQGQFPASQKIAMRVIGDKAQAVEFLKGLVPLLEDKEIIERSEIYLPKAARNSGLKILQIAPRVLKAIAYEQGWRCASCKTWRPYHLDACPTPRCRDGSLKEVEIDEENYYVRLYTGNNPQRLKIHEHSAQISDEKRAERETLFKDSKIDALVCTPTLELGVDIGSLLTVAMRNAPPSPASYAQRAGRAGRRLRIGLVSTFCSGGSHDRHAFETPDWLVNGIYSPQRLKLENDRIVKRHMRSFILESLEAQVPSVMGEFLDDDKHPTRWEADKILPIFTEVMSRKEELLSGLMSLFSKDQETGRTTDLNEEYCRDVIDTFEVDFTDTLERWFATVKKVSDEYYNYATVSSPRHDEKKALARKRAFVELTSDREKAYSLNYLSMNGLLPAYQFPQDTFRLDPGVADTPTLHRSAVLGLFEYAPGNYVYANNQKFRSIRVLYSGGKGDIRSERPARSDAESSGRLKTYYYCPECEEMHDDTVNACQKCSGTASPVPVETIFVDNFEAEEDMRIGADEESRHREYHVRKENLLRDMDRTVLLYSYPGFPLEYHGLSEILVTNWGKADFKTTEPKKFELCLDCGRHMPYDRNKSGTDKQIEKWENDKHRPFCSGRIEPLILGYRFKTDSLVLRVPSHYDIPTIGKEKHSPTLITLAEALLAGACDLLELEQGDILAYPRIMKTGDMLGEIVFYETVPGGAGYLEELALRFPEAAAEAYKRLFEGHDCAKACYLCLKNYYNQNKHNSFDKESIRSLLTLISSLDPVNGEEVTAHEAGKRALEFIGMRREELRTSGRIPGVPGPQSPIEQKLWSALEVACKAKNIELPVPQFEVRDRQNHLVTVPDFAYPDHKIAVFCDGFAFHGNTDTLELDANKRNWLQRDGWVVLVYWGRTIMKKAEVCAKDIVDVRLHCKKSERG